MFKNQINNGLSCHYFQHQMFTSYSVRTHNLSCVVILKARSNGEWRWLTSSSFCSTWDVTQCGSERFSSPLSPVRFRFAVRPLAPNLPTGPCKLHYCQVESREKTNPSCQCPASASSTPELGHTFHFSPERSRAWSSHKLLCRGAAKFPIPVENLVLEIR